MKHASKMTLAQTGHPTHNPVPIPCAPLDQVVCYEPNGGLAGGGNDIGDRCRTKIPFSVSLRRKNRHPQQDGDLRRLWQNHGSDPGQDPPETPPRRTAPWTCGVAAHSVATPPRRAGLQPTVSLHGYRAFVAASTRISPFQQRLHILGVPVLPATGVRTDSADILDLGLAVPLNFCPHNTTFQSFLKA
jgi:hypothetical protein